VSQFLRRSWFDVVERSENKTGQLAHRFGYVGLALALAAFVVMGVASGGMTVAVLSDSETATTPSRTQHSSGLSRTLVTRPVREPTVGDRQ